MKNSALNRMSQELKDAIYYRRITVKEAAEQLGISRNYLSTIYKERAPKKNYELLKATRKLYQTQLAKEVLAKKISINQAADLAHVSLRTMYRRVKNVNT